MVTAREPGPLGPLVRRGRALDLRPVPAGRGPVPRGRHVIVYAGAIIVTFLFVIMLAQSHGQAVYDRAARRPLAAALTGGLMLGRPAGGDPRRPDHRRRRPGGFGDRRPTRCRRRPPCRSPSGATGTRSSPWSSPGPSRETSRLPERSEPGETPAHVAGLGGTLFTDHLVTVEVAGLLLFVALIGAVAIATPKAADPARRRPWPTPGPRRRPPDRRSTPTETNHADSSHRRTRPGTHARPPSPSTCCRAT